MVASKLSFSLADFFALVMVALAISAVAYPLYQNLSSNSLREKQLKSATAENLFKNHGNCTEAKRLSKDFKCD